MKVFLSWSGETSHEIAIVVRDWLPLVLQNLVPYVSSEDIDKGTRWSTDIANELSDSSFGILCVTKDNINAPWLNFEAGALGKSVDKSKVCPLLFNIKRAELEGPLLQFQSTLIDKEDILKLLKSINTSCRDGENSIDEAKLEKIYEVMWPLLNEGIRKIKDVEVAENIDKKTPKVNLTEKILEEILELSRLNQKILRNPEELLPPMYVEYIFNRINVHDFPDTLNAIDELYNHYQGLELVTNKLLEQSPNPELVSELKYIVSKMGNVINYLSRKKNKKIRRLII